jgi:transcriptional/translational regulatory protein YebC/TACO1
MIGEIEVFGQISSRLKEAGIKPELAELRMIPNNLVDLDKDQTLQVFNVIEALEELDDVQEVYSNLNLSDEMMAVLESA